MLPRRSIARLAAILLACHAVASAAALDPKALYHALRGDAERVLQRFSPERVEKPPDWARRPDAPLARIAVLADVHYDDTGRRDWTQHTRPSLLKAVRYLNDTVRPDRLVILGDLIASGRVEQLRRIKELLDAESKAPCSAVWGNHDGRDFESVFGPASYSLSVGGVRLVALQIAYNLWDSGWGACERVEWLAREFAAHGREPTLLLVHNPVVLPTFANNAAVLQLVEAQPQVLGVLAGHMHVDYELRQAKAHLGLPMFGRPPHAFKVIHVHPDALLLSTYEQSDGAYTQAPIYQKIDIPPGLRAPGAP
ncbi:MAG TPA: metallophosphoesterase [Planctomycetota bacterium]|nr:metallophosphoesterase [Planctomycetota bacterium]HRR81240.1 metallophosphoesterase [Planctomycetota bacterium]HRT96721.1 metallophosphoesterase [Planctomycetota bacterium]